MIVPWAGVPPETRTLVEETFPHLTVHNLHHNADATAELAFALLLAAAKFIVHDDRALRGLDPAYGTCNSMHCMVAPIFASGSFWLSSPIGFPGFRLSQCTAATAGKHEP